MVYTPFSSIEPLGVRRPLVALGYSQFRPTLGRVINPSALPYTMSQCPHCFVGQCQRHRLQDHGKRELLLKAKMVDPKAAQKRLFDRVVTQQLDKLEAAARGANAQDQV